MQISYIIYQKHISCKCKCKFDGRKCSSNQNWNVDVRGKV